MLKVRLRKVVDFAYRQGEDFIYSAMDEFFDGEEITPENENLASAFDLFNEWLVFEYQGRSQKTVIADYHDQNPDNLPADLLSELKQIIKTNFFDFLEIEKVKPGQWIKVYALSAGKTYQVFDKKGSLSAPSRGTFLGRLAKVDGTWQLVGSDTIILPISHSPRFRKIYREQNKDKISCKLALSLLLAVKSGGSPKPPRRLTAKEVKNKRKNLEKKFNQITKDNNLKITFTELIDFTYNEAYKDNHADMFADIIKLGIPEEIVFKNAQLFVDIWNFFPHQCLEGKSPAEMC